MSDKPSVIYPLFFSAAVFCIQAVASDANNDVVFEIRLEAGTKGLRAQPAQGDPNVVAAGEPITIGYTIINKGSEPLTFFESDLDLLPIDFEIRLKDRRKVPSQLERRPKTRSGKTMLIAKGQSVSSESDLLNLFPPELSIGRDVPILYEPGVYTVQLVKNHDLVALPQVAGKIWSGTARSNVLTITVCAPTEEDRERLWGKFDKADGKTKERIATLIQATAQRGGDSEWIRFLADPFGKVRMIGCIGAVKASSSEGVVIGKIEELLQKDEDPLVRSCAAYALGKIGNPRSITVLIEAVKSRRERSYRAAVQALGMMRDRRAIPVLTDVAKNDSEEWVRKAAMQSIRNIEGVPKK